jgi:16S rRNA (cytosine967-C5)-methyltransferase
MKPFLKNQIENAVKLIEQYKLSILEAQNIQPLSIYLKDYFRKNPQMGSRDRKQFSSLVYNYFRLGNICSNKDAYFRMALGNFLCEQKPFPAAEGLISELLERNQEDFSKSISEKINFISIQYPEIDLNDLFPFPIALSEGLDKEKFLLSFFRKPKVWIRIRSKFVEVVKQELRQKEIAFQENSDYQEILSFDAGTSLDQLESRKKGYFEIQDLSSQMTGKNFNPLPNEKWWDCCAGSGGKSLMLLDQQKQVDLLSTDIRPQIITNLKQRLKVASHNDFKSQVLDISEETNAAVGNFDAIVADVPCSGSGTWARTPEMLSFFKADKLFNFSQKQKSIAANASKSLKKGGRFIYITCSVFKSENEEVVDFLINQTKLKLKEKKLITNPELGADSLFLAEFNK